MSLSNGSGPVRVLLVAASPVRRAGLESLISQSPQLKLVGSFPEASHPARQVSEAQANVLVHDVQRGHSYTGRVEVPVVLLVEEPTASFVTDALRRDARAILRSDVAADVLCSAIVAAWRGQVTLDAGFAEKLLASVPSTSSEELGITEDLSARELEVLRMLAEGLSNRDIGKALGISDHTVKFHISSIFEKLGASTRTEAVMLGVRMGLILL